MEFQLSNRVQNVSGSQATTHNHGQSMKMFGKATVDLNLSLGQLLRNAMFDEADIEFQQYAFFKTSIGMSLQPVLLLRIVEQPCLCDVSSIV